MAIGSPLAALDVVLGIAGLSEVMGGLRSLDREMERQQRRRAPQGVSLPGVDKWVTQQRAMNSLFTGNSEMARRYERSLGSLQRAINVPVRDYNAARGAMRDYRAGEQAERDIRASKARAEAVRTAGRAAIQGQRDTNAADIRAARSAASIANQRASAEVQRQRDNAAMAIRDARSNASLANQRARADVDAARTADQAAASTVASSRAMVASRQQDIRTLVGDLKVLQAAERSAAQAATQSNRDSLAEVRKVTAARSALASAQGTRMGSEAALKKQQQELAVLRGRQSSPKIEGEFAKTVTGSRMYEAQAELLKNPVKNAAELTALNKEIKRYLTAREDAHRISIERMERQETRLSQVVTRNMAVETNARNALAAQTAKARGAVAVAKTTQAAVVPMTAAVDAQKIRIQTAQAALATAQADLASAKGIRAHTAAALQVARSSVGVIAQNGRASVMAAQATGKAAISTAQQAAAAIALTGRSSIAAARQNAASALGVVTANAQAATQAAIASATAVAQRLGPIVANGGAAALARFRTAMQGVNPIQYLLGVGGSVMGVIGTQISNIGSMVGSVFKVGSMVVGGFFNVVRAGVSVVASLASGILQVGSGMAGMIGSIVSSPMVLTPLTGGLNLVVGHLREIATAAGLATAAIVALGAQQIVGKGMEFESSLSGVRSAMGYSPGMGNNPAAVEAQMARLQPNILKISADTQYNNAQVAEGVRDLLRGGLKVDQITDEVMRMLFNVSAGTSSSVSDSAKVVDSLIQLFDVPKDQLTKVGDMVAGVVNSSMMDMSEVGSALRQLGPLAKTMGVSYEDTLTTLTMLAGAGFRGEIGGTALRNMLIYMNPRSDKAKSELKDVGIIDAQGNNRAFDEKGNMRSMPELFQLLRGATTGMSDEDQLEFFTKVYGTRSASAAMVLSGTDPSKYNETKGRISGQSAAGAAATMMDNVAGKVEILTGTLESMAAVLFMNFLASPLKGLLDWIIGKANTVYNFLGQSTDMTAQFTDMFGKGATRLSAFLGIVRQFASVGDFLKGMNLVDLQIGLEAIFTSGKNAPMTQDAFRKYLMNPLTQVIRLVQLGRDGVITFAQAFRGQWGGAITTTINPVIRMIGIFGTYWGKLYSNIGKLIGGEINLAGFLKGVSGAFTELLTNIGVNIDEVGPKVWAKLEGWGAYLKGVGVKWWQDTGKPEFDQLWSGVSKWFEDRKPDLINEWNGLWSGLLGMSRPEAKADMNPLMGLAGTDPTAQADDSAAIGLGTIFQKMLDNGREVLDKNIKPVLDLIRGKLQDWWKENEAGVKAFGILLGTSIGQGLIDGLKAAFGPNALDDMLRKWLIDSGAIGAMLEKAMPREQKMPTPGGEGVGIIGLLAQMQGKATAALFGIDTKPAGGLANQAGANYAAYQAANPVDPKAMAAAGMVWDEYLNKYVPITDRRTVGKHTGNPFLPNDIPGAPSGPGSNAGDKTPAGTIPTALPRTGGGAGAAGVAGGDAALALVQQMGVMVAAALQAAAQPRTINVQGTGLTTAEFYEGLAQYLDATINGNTTGASVGNTMAAALGGGK